jgi:hypothetical protein
MAIERFRDADVKIVSAKQLFDIAYQGDTTLNTLVLNQVINSALTKESEARNGNKIIPALATEGAFYDGKKTKYSIAPEHIDGLRDLYQILRKINEGDRDTIDHFIGRAIEIYTDPIRVKKLLFKAKQSSPQKQSISDESLVAHLSEIVLEEGEVTIRAAINLLKSRGVKMSVAGASVRLMDLVRNGELQARTGQIEPRKAREVTIITGIGSNLHR